MLKIELIRKYDTIEDLEKLKNKIYNRFKKYGIIGNKISIAYKNSYTFINNTIEDLLQEDNFINCDLCNKRFLEYSKNIIENYDNDLNVCSDCQENYYSYCENCQKPIYLEGIAGRDYHLLDYNLFCNDCYFIEKDNQINNWIIKDKRLIELDNLLKNKGKLVNYDNLSDVYFKIKGYKFHIISSVNSYRLSSWSANYWIDLTPKENNLLKAIDWILENIIQEDIEYIDIGRFK